MTHLQLIDAMLERTEPLKFQENRWGERHVEAFRAARRFELPIVRLITAAAQYADAHFLAYESRIGQDGVLGDAWLQIIKSIRELLNGEIGRLDGGVTDRLLCDMLELEGFET